LNDAEVLKNADADVVTWKW